MSYVLAVTRLLGVSLILYQVNEIVSGASVSILNFAFVRCVMKSICLSLVLLAMYGHVLQFRVLHLWEPLEVLMRVCSVEFAEILDLRR